MDCCYSFAEDKNSKKSVVDASNYSEVRFYMRNVHVPFYVSKIEQDNGRLYFSFLYHCFLHIIVFKKLLLVFWILSDFYLYTLNSFFFFFWC